MQKITDWLKIISGFALCLAFRLIPIRPPNIEPLLAMQMPFAKVHGRLVGFVFAFMSIFLFDFLVGKLGLWTLITGITYGILGIWSVSFFKIRKMQRLNYVKFAIIGTLFFDAVTGLTIGPLFFGQSIMSAFVGQIPFTILHLIGSTTFAFFVSPLVYKYITTSCVFGKCVNRVLISQNT